MNTRLVDLLFTDKQLTLYSEYFYLMSAFICNHEDKDSINEIVCFLAILNQLICDKCLLKYR